MENVDIGVLEKTENWKLNPRFFPSKIGGKPSWLSPCVPKTHEIKCNSCEEPLVFLCQVYAPDEKNEHCFHRTIFVFVCHNGDCCRPNSANNFLVFRCQLPRHNDYYPSVPAVEDEKVSLSLDKWPKLCKLCGNLGLSHCSKCKKVNFCCRKHQIIDWQKDHKHKCESKSDCDYYFSIPVSAQSFLFNEYEIVIEDEINGEKEEVNVDNEMKKMKQLLKNCSKNLANVSDTELEQYTKKDAEDKLFEKFKKRVAKHPDQVLRYQRGGEPLWITDNVIPDSINIPNCNNCKGKRQFEFQIMPQLLNFIDVGLDVNSIDWGVICVYTCVNNCNDGPVYKQEYLIKQDFIENKLM